MEQADGIFERAKQISAEIDAAHALGDSQRVAELSRERRALRKDARVTGVDVERAREELASIERKLRKTDRKGRLRILLWMRGGGSEHHARTGTSQVFGEAEGIAALRERRSELVQLLSEAEKSDET